MFLLYIYIGKVGDNQNGYTLVGIDTYCNLNDVLFDVVKHIKTLEQCQRKCNLSAECRAVIYVKKWEDNCYLLIEACPKHAFTIIGSNLYSKN